MYHFNNHITTSREFSRTRIIIKASQSYIHQDIMDKQKRSFKVQTLSNQIYHLETSLNTKVSDIKTLIFDRTTIPADRQKLVFDSKVLDDEEPISTYLKNDDHTIFLMSRFDGSQEKQRKSEPGKDEDDSHFFKGFNEGFRGFNQSYNQGFNQPFNQGYNPIPFSGRQKYEEEQRPFQPFYPSYISSPGAVPSFRQPPPSNTLVPFQQEPQGAIVELSTLSEIISELGQLPCPSIPTFFEGSSTKTLGQSLAQWHCQMIRLLPYVYRLSQLLQKQDYLSQIGRLQTQQQIFNVSTALQASVNATVPLIMESNKVGSSINNFNPHFNFQKPNQQHFSQSFNPRQPPMPNPDGSFDFHQYPFGFTNPYNPIPMSKAPPFWDGKPPKPALSIAYGEADHSVVPLRQLVGNFNHLKSIWLQLFGDATISELFFVLSGDELGYVEKNRELILSKVDESTPGKIAKSLTTLLLPEGIRSLDPEGTLPSFIQERILPRIELILHLAKEGQQNYAELVFAEIKGGMGESLYEIAQSISKKPDYVIDTVLNSLKKTLAESFPNTETYFTLLSSKLRRRMLDAHNDHQRKMEDERNRLII